MIVIMSEQIYDKLAELVPVQGLTVDEGYLFHEGDLIRHLYFVRKGRVELQRIQDNGNRLILQCATRQCFLAEASLYTSRYHCDAMVGALNRWMPDGVRFNRPGGGMFTWLELPAGMDAKDLLARALAETRIAFVPGAAFHADGSGQNTLRLSFSTCAPEEIETGMQRLGELIASELGKD